MFSRFRTWSGRRARAPFGAPWLASVLSGAALVAGAWSGAARVLVPQCLVIDGPVATLGMRLLLLQDISDCPQGSLAVAPGLSQGLVLAVGLLLPVLAAHAAIGALGFGLIALVTRGARVAAAMLESVLPARRVPAPADRVRSHAGLGILVGDRSAPLSSGVPGECHPLRGPPVGLALA